MFPAKKTCYKGWTLEYKGYKVQIRVALFTQDGGRGHVLRMPRLFSLALLVDQDPSSKCSQQEKRVTKDGSWSTMVT
uniref:Uncharacterized protein n=1 Tax=Magallana gigas TaxID=29159 RepID=A0A8W8IGV5_MAGGI